MVKQSTDMKGSLILICSLFLTFTVKAEVITVADTLESATVTALASRIETTGLRRFDFNDLRKLPSPLGISDPIKVIQSVPGVSAGMELSSGLYVRGGDGNDNLFLIDGVPVFQISHLAGIFSSFNAEIIESLDFYRSGFPARFGGRLSSVTDIKTKSTCDNDFGGSFTVGLLEGGLCLHGPMIKDRLFYDVAFRKSWLEALLVPYVAINNRNKDDKTGGMYSLFDANVNLTYIPTQRDRVSLRYFGSGDWFSYESNVAHRYYGKDIYEVEDLLLWRGKWDSHVASMNWIHDFSDNSAINLQTYYSRSASDIENVNHNYDMIDEMLNESHYSEMIRSNINVAGIKGHCSVSLSRHRFIFGVEYNHNWNNPTKELSDKDDYSGIDRQVEEYYSSSSNELSAYVEDEIKIGRIKLGIGLRGELYFKDKFFYRRIEPRFSFSFDILPNMILKASYENMSQYAHLLSSIFLDIPTNVWMMSTDNIRPSDSRQVAAGLYYSPAKRWKIDVGAYYKDINNCIMYSGSGSLLPPIEEWEKLFSVGKGKSYGLESEFGYMGDRLRIDMFYTLSWSLRKFPEIYGKWFYDRYDNRHKLTLTSSYKVSDNIEINAAWTYHDGNRVTMPEYFVQMPDVGETLLFTEPYNVQMPDYHRLDLSCNFYKRTEKGNKRTWSINIYNLYSRKNAFSMTYFRAEDGRRVARVYSLIPFMPSVTYKLNF